MPYLRRVYRLPAELEESLVADLWQAGTLGVSTESEPDGRLRLTAWFAPEVPPPGIEHVSRISHVSDDEPPDTDWMAEYRRRAVPFPLGRKLLIDPREPEEAATAAAVPAGRRLLRLPARTAFGIGSHESTVLALELLEEAELSGRAVLDVGTGTGILAFAALAWGAARVVAFDADPVAVLQARANSRLNGLHPLLFAGRAAALAPGSGSVSRDLPLGEGPKSYAPGAWTPRPKGGRGRLTHYPAMCPFDLIVINVVPEEILPDLADLLPLLAPGGMLILSGLLADRAAEVAARLAAYSLRETGRLSRGDWTALRLSREAS
jgi:ribosomal protein L11 methylase PrmA